MISYWHLSLCIVTVSSRVGKLYRCVLSRAVPIHFFRHFCYKMYLLATIAVGCIMRAKTHGEKLNRQTFHSSNGYGQYGHVTMAIPDAVFSAVRFCISLLSDSCASLSRFPALIFHTKFQE